MKSFDTAIAVEGKHITKNFRLGDTTTEVLKDISFQVMQGEFVSIMGPPEKARCFIFLGAWIRQAAAKFF